ncbi:MAG TPA: tRNA (adenosine(37)-N6)-threonylcarbamoyltransferase complex dimerization subunit type 1 TsaB [Bacteroidales bacterium]|nr:tRNA (adenosine(37)-N6)-threonylcarbamoyltransferase complex dimerization subunit type 1 TsaB [Bacteroidales bacterium]
MILCIETATSVCSVALCERDKVVSVRENTEGKSHALLLTVFISGIFSELGLKASDLEAVAVSKGPGSFTGLRIGVSVAKGIAYRANIPLIGVDTLAAMFHGIAGRASEKYDLGNDPLYCPMLDARRMEVFYSVFDSSGKILQDTGAGIIDSQSFSAVSEEKKILFFGNGAGKCRDVIRRGNAVFEPGFLLSASHLRIPAYMKADAGRYEDVAYFEPFYLKDFIATIPRKSITGQ